MVSRYADVTVFAVVIRILSTEISLQRHSTVARIIILESPILAIDEIHNCEQINLTRKQTVNTGYFSIDIST